MTTPGPVTSPAASPVTRSAEGLVFGVDGPCAVVSGRVAAVLLTRAGLDTWRRQHRGDDPDVDAALIAMTRTAIEWRNRVSGNGHQQEPITVTRASCALTTARAADRLRCSPRTITRAIHSGRLPAQKIGRQWLIDPADLARYADHTGQEE